MGRANHLNEELCHAAACEREPLPQSRLYHRARADPSVAGADAWRCPHLSRHARSSLRGSAWGSPAGTSSSLGSVRRATKPARPGSARRWLWCPEVRPSSTMRGNPHRLYFRPLCPIGSWNPPAGAPPFSGRSTLVRDLAGTRRVEKPSTHFRRLFNSGQRAAWWPM